MADRVFVPGGNAIAGVVGNTSKGGYDRGKLLVATDSGGKLDKSLLPDGLVFLMDNHQAIISKLDSCLSDIGDMRRELSNFMADADERLDSVEQTVSGSLGNIETRVSGVEGRMAATEQAVSLMSSSVDSAVSRVDDLSNDVVPGLDGILSGIRDSVDSVSGSVLVLTSTIEGVLANVESISGLVMGLQADLNAKYQAMQDIVQTVGVLIDGVDSLDLYTEGLSSLRDDLLEIRDGLGDTVNGFIDRVGDVESSVRDLSNDLSDIAYGLSRLDGRIGAVETDYVTSSVLSESVVAVEDAVVDLSNDLRPRVSALEGRVSALESGSATKDDLSNGAASLRTEFGMAVNDLSNDVWVAVESVSSTLDGVLDDMYGTDSNDLLSKVIELQTRADDVDAVLVDLSNDLGVLGCKFDGLEERVDDLSNDVAELQSGGAGVSIDDVTLVPVYPDGVPVWGDWSFVFDPETSDYPLSLEWDGVVSSWLLSVSGNPVKYVSGGHDDASLAFEFNDEALDYSGTVSATRHRLDVVGYRLGLIPTTIRTGTGS